MTTVPVKQSSLMADLWIHVIFLYKIKENETKYRLSQKRLYTDVQVLKVSDVYLMYMLRPE